MDWQCENLEKNRWCWTLVSAGHFITLALRQALSQRLRWQADPSRCKIACGMQDSCPEKLFFDSLNTRLHLTRSASFRFAPLRFACR
jgi:hypothetical protein